MDNTIRLKVFSSARIPCILRDIRFVDTTTEELPNLEHVTIQDTKEIILSVPPTTTEIEQLHSASTCTSTRFVDVNTSGMIIMYTVSTHRILNTAEREHLFVYLVTQEVSKYVDLPTVLSFNNVVSFLLGKCTLDELKNIGE